MEILEKQFTEIIEEGRWGIFATYASLFITLFGIASYLYGFSLVDIFGIKSHYMHPLTGLGIISSTISLLAHYHSEIFKKNTDGFFWEILSKLTFFSLVAGSWVLFQLTIQKILVIENGKFLWKVFDPNLYFMPSPEACLCLILSSVSLLTVDAKTLRLKKISETCTLIFLGLTLLALAQLVSGTDSSLMSYLPIQAIGMALPTAFAFIFLGIGIFFYNPKAGYLSLFFTESLGAALARRLVWKVVFLPMVIELIVGMLVYFGIIEPLFRMTVANVLIFSLFIYLIWESVRDIDALDKERKKLATSLIESEEKYRSLIEMAPEAIFVADLDGRYVNVNEAAAKLAQIPRDQLIGKHISDLIQKEDLKKLEEEKKYLTSGDVYRISEWRLKQGNGNLISVEVSAKVLPQNRWIAFIRNIEDRKQAEERLRIAENQYRVLVESISEVLLLVDLKGIIHFSNHRVYELFGYEKNELLGRSIEFLIPERYRESHPMLKEFFEKNHRSQKMGTNSDFCCRRKDGTEFYSEVSLNIIEGLMNQEMISVVIRDVTDFKRIEKHERLIAEIGNELAAILDKDERLKRGARLITQSKGDWSSIFLTDSENNMVSFYSYSNDETKLDKISGLKHTVVLKSANVIANQVIAEKKEILLSHEDLKTQPGAIVCKDLVELLGIHSVCYFPLMARGRVFGVFALVRIKKDFDFYEFRLTKMAVDRFAVSVDNAHLYQEAQKAVKVREELMAIVSHDLRNPLSAINLGIQKLKIMSKKVSSLTEMTEQVMATTQRMESSVKRSTDLISDLLTFAKLESGLFIVDKKEINVSSLLRELQDNHLVLAQAIGVKLTIDCDSRLVVKADRLKLLQVLSNLVGNSLKHIKGPGLISVSAHVDNNHEVLFMVSDTGSGIPKTEMEKIFDRYWQPDRSRSQGAGLGLSIVKGIVEAHGGKVWLQSEVGLGTTFFFSIPLHS